MPKRKSYVSGSVPEPSLKARKVGNIDNGIRINDNKVREETAAQSDAMLSVFSQVPNSSYRAIFILENASLKKGFVRKKPKILNSEEHADFLLRQGKNLNDYRPDIVYEALKGILDSTLNKLGMVGAIYVKTDSGLLFEIKPHVRIPRTCKRFCGIILELFDKSCIRAKDTGEVLIRVLEGPVARHFPDNAHVVGLSYNSHKLVDSENYVSAATTNDLNLVFVVGAMVHGEVGKDYTNDYIAVSEYPLGTKCCIGLICEALEQKWKLL